MAQLQEADEERRAEDTEGEFGSSAAARKDEGDWLQEVEDHISACVGTPFEEEGEDGEEEGAKELVIGEEGGGADSGGRAEDGP